MDCWRAAEYASWEEAGCPESGTIYNILKRYKTVVSVWNLAEANAVLESAEAQGQRALDRIADKLRDEMRRSRFYRGLLDD